MGFRTVVMLSNDQSEQWKNDPKLGEKIMRASSFANRPERDDQARVGNYGRVVQSVHADSQTLAVLDGYEAFHYVAGKHWNHGESDAQIAEALLREAADKMGFRLVKKTTKDPKS